MNTLAPFKENTQQTEEDELLLETQTEFLLSKNYILRAIDNFDAKYSGKLASFIGERNPSGAYNYIQNSRIQKEYTRMHGCALIYGWLYNELTTIDADEIQGKYWSKIMNLLQYMSLHNKWKHQELMFQIEKEIDNWFSKSISESTAETLQAGAFLSSSLKKFPEIVAKDSPLGAKLRQILSAKNI